MEAERKKHRAALRNAVKSVYLRMKDHKKEALQKYDCIELFKLIKCIYFRRKQRLDEGKKVTVADDKYMHLAEDMLYQELGVVLDIPKDQVLDYIIKEIEGNI